MRRFAAFPGLFSLLLALCFVPGAAAHPDGPSRSLTGCGPVYHTCEVSVVVTRIELGASGPPRLGNVVKWSVRATTPYDVCDTGANPPTATMVVNRRQSSDDPTTDLRLKRLRARVHRKQGRARQDIGVLHRRHLHGLPRPH